MSILTGYTVDKAPIWSFANGRAYVTNDFDKMKVWDGLASSMNDAGITGPAAAPTVPTTAAGTTTVGTHLVRYRYLDSTSPASLYRSNASANYTLVTATAASAQAIFSVGVGQSLVPSLDPKVDTIQLEATLASGSLFYVVGTQLQTLTSFVFNLADSLLQVNALAGAYDDNPSVPTNADYGQGHEAPPLAAIVQQCRDYLFLGGFHARTVTANVTNGSASLTAASGLSTNWAGRMLRVGTDTKAYQLATVTSTTAATITVTYTGSTATAVSATITSKNPCRLYWSSNKGGGQLVESWKALTRARDVLIGRGERTITGLMEYQGDLIMCGRRTVQRLIFVDDPALGEIDTLPGNFGVWNQRCLVNFDGQVYGWGPNGFWTLRGGAPIWISKAVDLTIMGDSTTTARADLTKSDQFHGHADPLNKIVRWFYVPTATPGGAAGTVPTESVVYHLLNGEWSIDQFRQGMDASIALQDSYGRVRSVLSDATNGYSWYGYGATDGVPTSSTGAYVGSSGSTVTVTNIIGSLPTATTIGGDLKGVMLYRPGTGEEKAITSNTASAITTAAFATAVASGEVVYAGAIPFSAQSGWYDFGDLAVKQRAQFTIQFYPSSAGSVRVFIYSDFSTTPMTVTNNDSYTPPRGVTYGSNYFDIAIDSTNTTGFVCVPKFLEFSRALQWKVQCLSPAGTVRIQEIEFRTEKKDVVLVQHE